jgi:hypothetical protein
MRIRYKLTTKSRTTHGGFKIPRKGVWFYPADRESKPQPSTNTVLHHYAHPALALLFNPIHANIENPRLFEIEIDEECDTDGLKGWCRAQRIIRELPPPEITTVQRVAFAIYCAYPTASAGWRTWADKWLSGEDRSSEAAWAAEAAAEAAEAAAWAAEAAAEAAAAAAWAAWAAWAAAEAAAEIDFLVCWEKAEKIK